MFEPETERILRVIQKLAQINVLSTVETVKFALKRCEQDTNDQLGLQIIREAFLRESLNKWQTVTKFHQKPPTKQ